MPSASSVHVINSDDEDLEPSSDNSLPANKKRIEQRRSHREEESRSPTPSRRSDRRPSPSKKVQETLRDEALGKKVAKRKISDATSQSKPQKIIKSSQATAPVRKRTPQPKKNPANKDHARRSTTTVNRENTASQSYCAKKLTGNSQSTTYTTQLGGGLEFEDFQDATGDNGNNMDNEEVAPPVKVKIAKPKLKSKAHTAKEKELAEKIQREQNELFEDDENEYVDEDKAAESATINPDCEIDLVRLPD